VTAPLPISPAGTVAVHFGGAAGQTAAGGAGAASALFRRLGVGAARCDLGDQGLYLAEELVRADPWLADTEREALAYLVLAIAVAARQGATRVPLPPPGRGAARKSPLGTLIGDIARAAGVEVDAERVVRCIHDLSGRSHFTTTLGTPHQSRPLVVDDGCLYPHRLYWLEERVATHLAPRLVAGDRDANAVSTAVADVLARSSHVRLSDEQAAAVATACAAPVAVISGGPGTGKTQIGVAVVRVLARLGAARIALAAPTGKAANRLASSVAAQLAAVGDPGEADRALAAAPPPAQTLHRLLGYRPGDETFRHHEHNPVPFDAVLVDEASMVDLFLMERLLRALPATARLILLGDARQLPSVDAGQIFHDLVAVAAARRDGGWAATLTHSFRVNRGDPGGQAVLAAAAAIDAGEPERLLRERLVQTRAAAANLTWRGVELIETDGAAGGTAGVVDAWWRRATDGDFAALAAREYRRQHGAWAPGHADALACLFALHERSRLLTATRGQPTGSIALNQRLHRHMLDRATGDREPDFVPGEPVIMTANDHERGLYNGDPGVIVRVSDDGGQQRYRAVFRRGDQLVPFPLDAVRALLELAWAVTVHKSQGSEWDDVVVVLPQDDLPILTRELLYTALTRARAGAVVVGLRAVLTAAARRSAARHSGLGARLLARLP